MSKLLASIHQQMSRRSADYADRLDREQREATKGVALQMALLFVGVLLAIGCLIWGLFSISAVLR